MLKGKLNSLSIKSMKVALGVLVSAFLVGLVSPFYLTNASYSAVLEIVNNIFAALPNLEVNSAAETKAALCANSVLLLIWYVAGMSLIGVVLAYILLALRSFVLGFCLSILIMGDAAYGIVLSLLAILPQHLLLLPIFLFACVFSAKFSYELICGNVDLKNSLFIYSMIFVVLWFFAVLAACFQGYISPKLLAMFFGFLA
ncbi:MAG: stage II sporulation protein M [Clostridia bacterium]|nr:stage II sporulation protein M [Clostridia bacterium]